MFQKHGLWALGHLYSLAGSGSFTDNLDTQPMDMFQIPSVPAEKEIQPSQPREPFMLSQVDDSEPANPPEKPKVRVDSNS